MLCGIAESSKNTGLEPTDLFGHPHDVPVDHDHPRTSDAEDKLAASPLSAAQGFPRSVIRRGAQMHVSIAAATGLHQVLFPRLCANHAWFNVFRVKRSPQALDMETVLHPSGPEPICPDPNFLSIDCSVWSRGCLVVFTDWHAHKVDLQQDAFSSEREIKSRGLLEEIPSPPEVWLTHLRAPAPMFYNILRRLRDTATHGASRRRDVRACATLAEFFRARGSGLRRQDTKAATVDARGGHPLGRLLAGGPSNKRGRAPDTFGAWRGVGELAPDRVT